MADILDKFKIEGPSFIAQCVILLVVFAVLNKFAFGPVMQLLLERRQRIEDICSHCNTNALAQGGASSVSLKAGHHKKNI